MKLLHNLQNITHSLLLLIKKLYDNSFVRFAIVGGIATGITYGTYLLQVSEFPDLSPTIAYVIAFCISIVCNFILSSYFTFCVAPSWARAAKFLTAHMINLANELILLNIWLWLGMSKFYAPLLVFLVAFPINYFMVRFALRDRFGRKG